MKKAIAIFIIVLLFITIGTLLFLRVNEDTWICSNGVWVKHGNPTASKPTTNCTDVKGAASTVSQNANIILDSPKAGETIGPEFVIKGKARVFENQLNFRVRDAKGNPLIEGTMAAKASGNGQYGPFEVSISSTPKGKATIEVFDKSAKDGEEIDKISINVIIK